jgi:1-phosphatidylinositol-4-phosphate 5-kinase
MVGPYVEHIKNNPNSLLSKILGIFTVEAERFSKVHIMLMENTVRLKDPKKLRAVFDLKGSTVDRLVTKRNTTLKDVNFILTKRKNPKITKFDGETTKMLVRAMRKDVAFLSSLNLMDYSMLIAIEKTYTST